MSKGDIILVPFPFTDLTGQKVRPALVLHAEPKGEDCIVVFISSAKPRRSLRFDVAVTPSAVNGLKVPSVIKVNKIATLQKKIAIGELGTLEATYLTQVDRKLKQLLSL
ncbi:type II toxin-antitoxin system PemK/MazF family toxin [Candidatus Kaiserbacteria bacterium]|nr:type II toxin-antitoxin system PemK/MazF family toxin [Candidatus Kaiserbacteria bacterium]